MCEWLNHQLGSLQSLALGYHLPANLEKVLRMKSLQSLSFGVGFNQSLRNQGIKHKMVPPVVSERV